MERKGLARWYDCKTVNVSDVSFLALLLDSVALTADTCYEHFKFDGAKSLRVNIFKPVEVVEGA